MSSTQNTSSGKGKYLQYVKVLSNRPQRNTENKTVLCGYTCLEDDIFGEVESLLCNAFIDELKKYIHYYNNERISLKLKGMSPVQFRTHSQNT